MRRRKMKQDGRPHPDNVTGDKFKLCVKGIEWVKKRMAPRMKECYVWLDFGCINQDGNPAGELEQLDKIVQCCDAIFTPIVDLNPDWKFPILIHDMLRDYKAKLWNDGPHAYLNRGWCRVEMLYAANIPILDNDNSNSDVKRHTLFEAGLAVHCRANRRPHLLFGHIEMKYDTGPIVLPPLQNSYFTNYHPLKGNLSVESDIDHIQSLVDELTPYMEANKVKVGYEGNKNEKGEAHGFGIEHFASGDVYEGYFENDLRNGHGTYRYTSGSVYEGEYRNSNMEGRGTYRWPNGDVYEGEWKNNKKDGQGIFRFANGDVYEGNYKNGNMEGHGIYRYANGDVYEGNWKNDKKYGQGIFRWSSGSGYEGEWKNGNMDGHGTYRHANGDVFEGEYKNDKRISGICKYINGDVYEGEFNGRKREGRGILRHAADGRVEEGMWIEDVLQQQLRQSCCVVS